jgi:adenylate cyclase
MCKIFLQTDHRTIGVPPGSTILEALIKAGINHMHVCGGNSRCSTCRVYVIEGLSNCLPRNEKEMHMAEKLGFPEDIRLACQTRIKGDITIRRPALDDMDREIIMSQLGDASRTKLGQEKELAILFTDIENYTPFAEAFPAYDVVHVLNRYYQVMNEIIVRHNGIISDVAGDGILALFGVMEESGHAVLDAIHTVMGMNEALVRFNEYLHQIYTHSFGIRAGIHFGKVVVGNFDTGKMNKISAIGDAVNLASRIETANKGLGTRLLISQSAFDEVRESVQSYTIHRTSLKGKSGEHELYEIKI